MHPAWGEGAVHSGQGALHQKSCRPSESSTAKPPEVGIRAGSTSNPHSAPPRSQGGEGRSERRGFGAASKCLVPSCRKTPNYADMNSSRPIFCRFGSVCCLCVAEGRPPACPAAALFPISSGHPPHVSPPVRFHTGAVFPATCVPVRSRLLSRQHSCPTYTRCGNVCAQKCTSSY